MNIKRISFNIMKIYFFYFILLSVCLLLFPDESTARYIEVPAEFSTIQDAVDASFDGDVILVSAGTYSGSGNTDIKVDKMRNIIIESINGAKETVMDCGGVGRGFEFVNCESELIGFTIRNGGNVDEGGGILCVDASPRIAGCIIVNNKAGFRGGGIAAVGHAWPLIEGSVIDSNTVDDRDEGKGGGIYFEGDKFSSPRITNSMIRWNSARLGGGLYTELFDPIKLIAFVNSIFLENSALKGGAAYVADSSPVFIGCTFSGNISSNGSCFYACEESRPSVLNCIVWDNESPWNAPGNSNFHVTYSDIQGGWSGEGNVEMVPGFLKPAAGDLHLKYDSPLINIGSNEWKRITMDIDGDVRPDPFTGLVDMGADEYSFLRKERTDEGLPYYSFIPIGGNAPSSAAEPVSPSGAIESSSGMVHRDKDADPDTLLVPIIYGSIGEALDAARDGDLILVAPGTYFEHDLDYHGKEIVLRSISGAENTIIDCNSEGRGFLFHTGESESSILTGFTIRNGLIESDGGGISCIEGSSPLISSCRVIENVAGAHNGGGIFCAGGASPRISDCSVRNNRSVLFGGGMHCRDGSNPVISNCVFEDNSAGYGAREGGGLFLTYYSSPELTDCTFSRNSGLYGGGICCRNHSAPIIDNCIFENNNASKGGGGIACFFFSNPVIKDCTITGNEASRGASYGYNTGGGILCAYYSSPSISRCSIMYNAAFNGGGIDCTAFASPLILNCMIFRNIGDTDGGGLRVSGFSNPEVVFCTITGNIAASSHFPREGHGGGIRSNSSDTKIVDSIIWGNFAKVEGADIYINSGDLEVVYSDVGDGWPGTGNIDANPGFVNPEEDDFHLESGSPCVDAGINILQVHTDIEMDLRPDREHGLSDMGADEISNRKNADCLK